MKVKVPALAMSVTFNHQINVAAALINRRKLKSVGRILTEALNSHDVTLFMFSATSTTLYRSLAVIS